MMKKTIGRSLQSGKPNAGPNQSIAEISKDKPSPEPIPENAIVQNAVERSHAVETLQLLTGKLMQAQEDERRRIGRELHDGLNQQLAMFAVELGLLARMVPAEASELAQAILNLRHRAEGLSEDLRDITHQLHPAVLEHLGLVYALRSLCDEFTRNKSIYIVYEVEQEIDRIPPDIAICLYRITQEALRNIARHSGAPEAQVTIGKSPKQVQLSIVDQGIGFDPATVRTSGLGLVSMGERVRIVGGDIQIQSSPKEGTAIRIRVPITWEEHESEPEEVSATHAAAG